VVLSFTSKREQGRVVGISKWIDPLAQPLKVRNSNNTWKFRLRAVSFFFLVRRAKRARHENGHACDGRRGTGEKRNKATALVSRGFVTRRSRARTTLTKSDEKATARSLMEICFSFSYLTLFFFSRNIEYSFQKRSLKEKYCVDHWRFLFILKMMLWLNVSMGQINTLP